MAKLKPNQFTLSGHLITERPILFQTEMVQANLEDRKTQTRREVKGIENFRLEEFINGYWPFKYNKKGNLIRVNSPYGKPGDLLWVRETWAKPKNLFPPQPEGYVYKSNYDLSIGMTWKPSIHMPKSAARLWLMVEDIRVERVQEISEQDAKSEGIKDVSKILRFNFEIFKDYFGDRDGYLHAPWSFRSLWYKINGEASWDENPWVWVVQYRILSKTGRPAEKTILHHFLNIVKGEKNYMTI